MITKKYDRDPNGFVSSADLLEKARECNMTGLDKALAMDIARSATKLGLVKKTQNNIRGYAGIKEKAVKGFGRH